jgi:ParB family chromosome partitioning protein
MARRRLTLAHGPDVPRAEHFRETKDAARQASAAPIARQAAESAGAAAFEELAETLIRARETGRMVLDLPLGDIAPDHLARDRMPAEDAEMAALRESIRAHGQRTPVEVTPLKGALPYGLISGWRRIAALKALHAETGEARFATVQALVRRPETAADAYVNMVEENEIRLGLSHYERARVAALATERGIFDSEKKALLTLFATASRAKRSRIRAFLDIYHALDGTLRFPAHLPERLGLKLVEMVRAGRGEAIREAVAAADPATPEAEIAALTALAAPPRKRRSRAAAEELRPGVVLEEDLRGRTLTLRLKGPGVTPGLRAEILAALRAASR